MASKISETMTLGLFKRLKKGLYWFLAGPLTVLSLAALIYIILVINEMNDRYFEEELLLLAVPILFPFTISLIGFLKLKIALKELEIKLFGKKQSLINKPAEVYEPKAYKPVFEDKAFEKEDRPDVLPDSLVKEKKAREAYSQPELKKEKTVSVINWEEWLGKKLLQKLGIAVVLIGMVVFLKYSFDNGWVGPNGRIALSALAACVLLGAGEWFQTKYRYWFQAFSGGGLVLLYFTVWAARVFYAGQLMIEVTAPMAMVLYSLITGIGALAAIRYNAQTIAWFAVLGGYLTPLLIASPTTDPQGLTVYLILLTVGILALSAFAKWRYLNIAAFILTQVYLFGVIYPEAVLTDLGQIITSVIFFAMFGSLPLLYQIRLRLKAGADDICLIILNGLAVFSAVIDAVGGLAGEYTGLVSLLLAAVYILYAAAALLRCKDDANLVNVYLLASVTLIALALYKELTWEWVAAGWVPFSVLLLLVSKKLKQTGPLYCAGILLVLGLFFLLLNTPVFDLKQDYYWYPFTSDYSLQSYIVFGCLVVWIYLLKKMPRELFRQDSYFQFKFFLHFAVVVLAFAFITFETCAKGLYFEWQAGLPLTSVYLFFVVAAMTVYIWLKEKIWLGVALVVQGLVLIFLFINGSETAEVIAHPWALLSLLTVGVTVGIYYLLTKKEELLPEKKIMPKGLIITALMHVWLHVTIEIYHLGPFLEWDTLLAGRVLSGWWIIFALVLMAYSVVKNMRWLLFFGLLLLLVPYLKDIPAIVAGLHGFYETAVWTVVTLLVSGVGSHKKFPVLLQSGLWGLCILAGLDMLSHHASGFFWTVWWALAGLVTMVIGFQQRQSVVRKVAIGLFLAATVKLLVFDFSTLTTGVRIAASIVTGLLMIGASYLYQRFDQVFKKP